MSRDKLIKLDEITNRICTIRDVQVMIDSDLAEFYGVETKQLNRAVKRNIERFPNEFRFQLSQSEYDSQNLRFQFGTSSEHGGRRYLPYVFTEQGVAMLSAVLKSETAVKVSVQIINAFVAMRRFILFNAQIFQRLDTIELKQLDTDKKIDTVLSAIENRSIQPNQGIFFDGQIFDAYQFVSDLVRSAQTSIILIDNYIDDTVLTLFSKRKKDVALTVMTKTISKQLKLDVKKFNDQYPPVVVQEFKNSHDRFLIIDGSIVFHFGASLKDLGKKWFAFSKLEMGTMGILAKLKDSGNEKVDG